MPKKEPDKYREFFSQEPQFYSTDFKKYLNSFSGTEFTNPNGDTMTKEEKACWQLLKGKDKGDETTEQVYSYDITEFTKEDCKKLMDPSIIAANYGTFEFACKTDTTFEYIGKDQEGNTQVATWVAPSNKFFNLVNKVIQDEGFLAAFAEIPKIAEKRIKEIEKEEAKEKESQDAKENSDEKVADEDAKENAATLVVEQHRAGNSREAIIDNALEELQELAEGEVERVDIGEIDQVREEFGMVEEEPEVLTDFRAQAEDSLGLEQSLVEEMALRRDDD